MIFPVLICVFYIFTGMVGIDYGYHYDEWYFVRTIRNAVTAGSLLPGNYVYPSFCYDIGLISLLKDAFFHSQGSHGVSLNEYLSGIVESPQFLLRMRTWMLIVSSLSIIWVALASSSISKRKLETIVAAALMGFSWEAAYHSRFFVSDTAMMQFSALTLFFLMKFLSVPRDVKWLRMAAFAAGLGFGTKYTAILFFIPLAITILIDAIISSDKSKPWKEFFICTAVFTAAFLIVNPGILKDYQNVLFWLKYEKNDYSKGVVGYSVSPGIHHFLMIFQYLSCSVFSPNPFFSFVFFLLSVIGAAYLVRNDLPKALPLLGFFLSYILFFSQFRAMIVRNLLSLIPYFAVLAAHGLVSVSEELRGRKKLSWTLKGFVILIFSFNAFWLASAAFSIKDRHKTNHIAQLASYFDSRPKKRFLISSKIYQELKNYDGRDRDNVLLQDDGKVSLLVMRASEINRQAWIANRFNYTEKLFGPFEMNFNYYPCWMGDDRIVVIQRKWAELLSEYQ